MWTMTAERSDNITVNGTLLTPSPVSAALAVQLSLLAACSLLGTMANALVFAVFYRRPSLRTISNRFVLSLILANLMSASLSIPGHMYQLLDIHRHPAKDAEESLSPSLNWCWHQHGLDGLTVLVSLASVLSILLISLDRYYAVNSPLHYSIIVTRQRSIAMIAVVWFTAGILSAPVWVGAVLLRHQQMDEDDAMAVDDPMTGLQETVINGSDAEPLASSLPFPLPVDPFQYWINLCYSVALILFGFAWPLCALCWLYLRMYEAALKNSARTRRQSLCSNPAAGMTTNTANNPTVVLQADEQDEPEEVQPALTPSHHPSLTDALSSATAAAAVASAETQYRLLAAAAAAAAGATSSRGRHDRHPGNRTTRWPCWNGRTGSSPSLHQQVLSLLWREEGRALRTTAMVVSSFTCCWLPFFVWLLPLQLAEEPNRLSVSVFLARLAAFSNVLISPAIYVYRNQVAQKEASRLVRQVLFCRCRSGPNTLMGIAAPLVLGGAGLTHHHQIPTGAAGQLGSTVSSYQRTGSHSSGVTTSALTAVTTAVHSRRSSSLAEASTNSNSLCCGTDISPAVARRHQEPLDRSIIVDPPSPLDEAAKTRRSGSVGCSASAVLLPAQSHKRTRASISGYSTAESEAAVAAVAVAASAAASSARQRSQTVSATRRSPSRPPPSDIFSQPTVYQSESVLQVILPVTYPSLDFFDTGLEEHHYNPRAVSSSFSRYIQHQHQQQPAATEATAVLPPRRRRTYSLTRVLSGRKSLNRWPAVFGGRNSSTPSRAGPTVVTAV